MTLAAAMASGVWAPVRTMSGSATALSRQPVQTRSIWRAALRPSLPAQTSVAYGRPSMRPSAA
jgi:hypothetical protein